jgi:hypothetical protein
MGVHIHVFPVMNGVKNLRDIARRCTRFHKPVAFPVVDVKIDLSWPP